MPHSIPTWDPTTVEPCRSLTVWHRPTAPTPESHPCTPRGLYSVSKRSHISDEAELQFLKVKILHKEVSILHLISFWQVQGWGLFWSIPKAAGAEHRAGGALLVQGGTQKPPGPYAAIQAAVLPALPCSCYLTVLNLTHRDEQSADAAWTCFAVQMHFHRVSLHAPLLPSARRIPLGFVSLTGTTGALMSNAGVHFLPCLPIQHKCQHADHPAGLSDGEWINIWSYKAWEEPFCTHTARHTWDWVRLTDRLLKRSVPMDQTLQNELILHTGWYFFKLSSSVKKKSKKRKRAACFDTNFQKRHVFSNSNLS